jgi:hypothetical protein
MTLDLAFDTIRPCPIIDVEDDLDLQSEAELQRRIDSLYEQCCASAPDDHVSYSCVRFGGEYCVRLVSGPLRGRVDVQLWGAGPTKREALVDFFRRQLTEEDIEDDRSTLISELEHEGDTC